MYYRSKGGGGHIILNWHNENIEGVQEELDRLGALIKKRKNQFLFDKHNYAGNNKCWSPTHYTHVFRYRYKLYIHLAQVCYMKKKYL